MSKLKKVAVLQLGTTSVKLILAYILPNKSYVVFDQMVESIRIAEDVETDGIIKTEKMQETVEALKVFKALCDANDISETIAVTSDSIKKAKNQKGFLDELYNETGFSFDVIKNEDRLKNIYNAIVNSLDEPKGLIINITGVKVDLIQYSRRNILNKASIDLGALTMTEKYFNSEDYTVEQANEKVIEIFDEEFSKIKWLKKVGPEFKVIGSGPNVQTVVKIIQKIKKYPLEFVHAYEMDLESIDVLYNKIKNVDLSRASKIKGVNTYRADLLGSTTSILKSLFKYVNSVDNKLNEKQDEDSKPLPKRTFISSNNGFLEGVLLQRSTPAVTDKPITDIVDFSLDTIDYFYNNYETNNEHVYELVKILYDEIRVLHKLPKEFKKILKVATRLYDSGKKINHINYERNSFDVILNSPLYGLTHRELLLASFIASSQNLDNLKASDWVRYKDILGENDLEAVKKLAIMIKLAASLDRFNKTRVIDLNCDILGDSVIVKTILDGKAVLELREARKVNSSFKAAFGKSLEIL